MFCSSPDVISYKVTLLCLFHAQYHVFQSFKFKFPLSQAVFSYHRSSAFSSSDVSLLLICFSWITQSGLYAKGSSFFISFQTQLLNFRYIWKNTVCSIMSFIILTESPSCPGAFFCLKLLAARGNSSTVKGVEVSDVTLNSLLSS